MLASFVAVNTIPSCAMRNSVSSAIKWATRLANVKRKMLQSALAAVKLVTHKTDVSKSGAGPQTPQTRVMCNLSKAKNHVTR